MCARACVRRAALCWWPFLYTMDGFDVSSIEVFLFDCDGVLFRGSSVIAGVPEVLDLLQHKHGKRVYYVTNNATKSREDNAKKLRAFGIAATREQVICSSYAAAALLQSHGKKRVFVVGESGIHDELLAAQLEPCTERCDAVVAGLDRSFTYDKMAQVTFARVSDRERKVFWP